jgi:type I restriction enzyme S subunit
VSTRSIRIEEFCTTGAGGTPSRTRPEFYGAGIPWVKSGELRDGVIETTEENVTEEGVRSARLRVAPKGTLLVAMYDERLF